MNFLAPLFLAGLAAVALPVWLHLLQTQTPERQPFSSAMLLKMSEQRIHLRRRLRYLTLLALRIALFALLALAFSQPLWQRSESVAAAGDSREHLIVIDTSLSMGQGDRAARALAEARRIIDGLGEGDSARLATAGESVDVLATSVPATATVPDSRAQLVTALETVRAGSGRLDFGVLAAGMSELAGTGTAPVVIHLISDFQASGLPSQFGALIPRALPNRTQELKLYPLTDAAAPNWAVDYLRRTPQGLDVGVRGYHTPAADVTVTISLNAAREIAETRPIPAAGVGEYSFPLPDVAFAPGDNRIVAQLQAVDELPGDDRRFLVVPNVPAVPVPLLTTRVDAPLVRYLSTAFDTAARQYRVEPAALANFDPRTLERSSWAVADDLGAISPALATALTDYVTKGGSLLAAAGARSLNLETLPVTGHRIVKAEGSAREGQPFTVGRIDSGHPLLAATDGWRGISITRFLPLDVQTGDRVLIALEDGRPLLIERPLGEGRILLLATSLDNTWNDLPVHPVFVSFVAETARYLSGEQTLSRQQIAGSSLPLSVTGGASGQVVDPEGRTVLSLADTRRAQDVRLRQTGFYQVYTPGKETLVAVNADPRESDLEPMTAEQINRWQQAAIVAPQQAVADAAAQVAPPPLELWRYLLILLVLVVLVESLLGNRYLTGHLHGLEPDAGRASS
jgi:Aerotolerance regulator N-terminal